MSANILIIMVLCGCKTKELKKIPFLWQKGNFSFAVFGNASKAFDSHQITEILGYLGAHEADVYIEQNFYNSLQKELKKSISIAGVFEG